MPIQIQPLTAANLGDARRVNSQYEVTQRLVLRLEDGRLRYRVEPVSPTYFKDYHADPARPEDYVDTPDRTWLLAYAGGQVVGLFTPVAFQADSTATTIAGLVTDFNSLLAKLKAAGLMEPTNG